jgi:tRNA dimethylallyltransferase
MPDLSSLLWIALLAIALQPLLMGRWFTLQRLRAIRAIEIAHYQAQEQVSATGFPSLESVVLGVHIDRELRRAKITARLKARLQEGMIDEVKSLLNSGVASDDLIYYGLEYKYVTLHVLGAINYEEMYRQLEIAIHQFAKRQMTWFRGMERRGIPIHWIDASLPMEQKIDIALSYLPR